MKKNVRRGFTLPEILVTVTVIAVLAAVVVPTVLQYVSKGDGPSVLSEIDAIKKGMIGFTADTRHYPRTLQQLTGAISSTGTDLNNATYAAADSALWKGPYFEGTVSSTAASDYATKALGVKFNTTLVKCATNYICLQLDAPTDSAAVRLLDKAIDGGDGNASGSLIWTLASPATSIFFKLGVAN